MMPTRFTCLCSKNAASAMAWEHHDDVLARQFRLHLHRGIAYLAAPQTIRSIGDLIRLAEEKESNEA